MARRNEDESTTGECWLVAHDFSACADAAADLALSDLLARRERGSIVLVHVVAPIALALPAEGAEASASSELERSARTDATRRLEEVAERLRRREKRDTGRAGLVEIEVVARYGAPADGIAEEAELRAVDRIVVGTHGRTGVRHLLLGSVAERVVRLANVPVIVARPSPMPKTTRPRVAEVQA